MLKKSRSFPYVAISVFTFICAVLCFMMQGGFSLASPDSLLLIQWGANFSGLTIEMEPWRLVSCIWLHGSWLHFITNTSSLLFLGFLLESRIGHLKFFLVFIFSGIGGSIFSLALSDFQISVGASGALFGLLGTYLMVLVYQHQQLAIRRQMMLGVLLTISLNLLVGISFDFIDNGAHAGGLMVGLILGLIFKVDIDQLHNHDFTGHAGSLIGIIVVLPLLYGSMLSLPTYPPKYYQAFKAFQKNEIKALAIEDKEGFFTDPLYYDELNNAKELWQQNLDSIQPFESQEVLAHDVRILKEKARLAIKGIGLIQKSIEAGSFVYIDQYHSVTRQIRHLPPLDFPISLMTKKNQALPTRFYEEVRVYFDENWLPTSDTVNFKFFRIAQRDSIGQYQGWVSDYYRDSTLQMKAQYRNNIMDGIVFYFHRNGAYQSTGLVEQERKIGKWQSFYQNGTLQSEVDYTDYFPIMRSAWDSLHRQQVIQGNGYIKAINYEESIVEEGAYIAGLKNGLWIGRSKGQKEIYYEEYVMGQLQGGWSVDPKNGGKVGFKETFIAPRPMTGQTAYDQYIEQNLEIPNELNSERISLFEIYVDVQGRVTSARPIVIYGNQIDDHLEEILINGPNYFPAIYRGIEVGARKTVVIKF